MTYNEATYRVVQLDRGTLYPEPAQFISVEPEGGDYTYGADRRQILNRNFADAMLDVAWPACHSHHHFGQNDWQYRSRAAVLPLFDGHASLTVRVAFPHKGMGEWEVLDHLAFQWTPFYKPPKILRNRNTQEMWALGEHEIVIGKRDLCMVRKPFDIYLVIDYDEDVPASAEEYIGWRNNAVRKRGRL